MSDLGRVGDLELDEDEGFLRREWKAERVGWLTMAGILGLALLGVFGSGPLAEANAGGDGPLAVRYARFARTQAPTILRLRYDAGAVGADGRVRLVLDRGFVEAVQIEHITPQPERAVAEPGRVVYVFAAEPAAAGEVTFHARFERFGVIRGAAGLADRPPVRFTQWVHP